MAKNRNIQPIYLRKIINLTNNKKGMMVPLVFFAAIIILAFAYAFHQYRVAQIAMTDEIARFYAATCVAEAGVACAISELRSSVTSWRTHTINNDANFSWGNALTHTNNIKPAGILTAFDGTNGTVTGKLGMLGEFKVRCGLLPAKDNPDTKSINESNMFYKIESIGKYLDTYVKVETIVEARNLSEFLVYDGDFLDMVLGVANSILPDAANRYSIGTLYGRRYVFLGSVNGGPKLELKDMSNIMTGSTGEIYTFDNRVEVNNKQLDRTLNSSKALIAPTQGNAVTNVSQLKTQPGWNANFDTVNGVLKDAQHGGRDMPIISSKNFLQKYKSLAQNGGIYIKAPGTDFGIANDDPNNLYKFENPYKIRDGAQVDTKDMRYVDFGSDVCSRAKDKNDPAYNLQFFAGFYRPTNLSANILNKINSNNFNGVIFSEVPLRIRGNPPRDLVIASSKDIYICGDFNQATDVLQNYVDDTFLEYQPNPINGKKYLEEDTAFRKANPNANKSLYRHRVTIFSNAKVWYDYIRPDMPFENELKPFLEWELSTILAYGDLNDTNKKHVYDKIMKFKVNNGKIDVSNLNNYVLEGQAGSILKAAETKNKWGDISKNTSLDTFCNDPIATKLLKYLDDLFEKDPEISDSKSMSGKDFIKQAKFKVRDVNNPTSFQEKNFLEIINDPSSPGKLSVVARTALVDAVFEKISELKPKCLWADHKNLNYAGPEIVSDPSDPNKPSPKASIVGKLYHETGIIYSTKKNYCQFKKASPNEFEFDRLFMPEITINARIITSDLRRPDSVWYIGNTPQAIYNELGNRYLPNCGYKQYLPQVTGLFRLLGSEIFLRENNVLPPMKGLVYFPNLRRKIYDAELTNFEDPQGLTNYGLTLWNLNKADKNKFDTF